MDESTKNYRKGELDGLKSYEGFHNVKVAGAGGTESKWLSITEEELADIRGILTGDAVNTALNILSREGFAVAVYGPEEVHRVLDLYMEDNTSGAIDTLSYRDEITRHVMEGDDWDGILDASDTTAYLWDVIEGTHNDHPEWFPEAKPENPLADVETPELVEEYASLRAASPRLNHEETAQLLKVAAELRERGIIR